MPGPEQCFLKPAQALAVPRDPMGCSGGQQDVLGAVSARRAGRDGPEDRRLFSSLQSKEVARAHQCACARAPLSLAPYLAPLGIEQGFQVIEAFVIWPPAQQ